MYNTTAARNWPPPKVIPIVQGEKAHDPRASASTAAPQAR
jgi:hypothetical protein